jgi:WD40 repeat protein
LIALAVKLQAFTEGSAVEEIHALWKAAQQKAPLDEYWLSTLLDHQSSSQGQSYGGLHIVPKPVEESMSGAPAGGQVLRKGAVRTGRGQAPYLVDWGDALAVPTFYGREQELAQLTQWILQEHCRVVSILGMGGIGKSTLAVSLMHQLTEHFEVIIFRSLRDAPPCEVLLDECLQVFSPQEIRAVPARLAQGKGASKGASPLPTPTEQRISLLLSHLHKKRALVVLDNMESLLEVGDVKGHLRPGFEEYELLLHRVAETGHQSCLLLTSRERSAELRLLEGRYSRMRSLRLAGLDSVACQQLFVEKEVVGTVSEQEQLVKIYGGNPLALKIVAETISDLFGGEIGAFMAGETVLFGNISELLDEQFARLSALEQSVLCWLAIAREPMILDELLALLIPPLPRIQVFEAVDGLHRRSLIERGKHQGSFTLQSVVLEYVTAFLIIEGSREIQQHRLDRLIRYGLSQATAREYVRQAQERLLLSPLLTDLQNATGRGQAHALTDSRIPIPERSLRRAGGAERAQGTVPTVSVEGQLLSLLNRLRERADSAQGYGPANLIALLRLQRGHLSGLDLSRLCIRGASLQGTEMHDTSLAGALIRDTAFTEAASATWDVAISQDGTLWAASGMQGEVRVWGEGGRTLRLIWQAHAYMVTALAFSPDGRTLASGGLDGTVKLWDVEAHSRTGASGQGLVGSGLAPDSAPTYPHDSQGTLLWTDWQNNPLILAFSPDGSLLACSGLSATVRLWDTQSGTLLQCLEHPGQVFAVAWSPDGWLLASSCFDGQLRLWERQESEPRTQTLILRLATSWEMSPAWNLAFAPDGKTLACLDWGDRRVTLWEVETCSHEAGPRGRLLHTFEGETNRTNRTNKIAWSPDGRTLASCSYHQTIRLWDMAQRRHRATLYGHTSDINGLAFTPDSSNLLSGSDDGTLRVWDVESGQCVRVIRGYAVSHYSLDWSPDGRQLVSGGTDGLVTIWDIGGKTPPRELCGHPWVVWGVGWSPDGRFVASCGLDAVMRLWDPTSGACVQGIQGLSTTLLGMAWSPDGSLLAVGTFQQGMYVWNAREGRRHWVGEPDQNVFLSAAWSPDGSLLAGGSGDGSVYLWESADGTKRKRLSGHHGNVTSLAWSPDGTKLASGSGDSGNGELFVWDVRSGECMRSVAEHASVVYAVAWSSRTGARHSPYDPCEDLLISGGSDGRLRWWDVQSEECVSVQDACHGTIRSLKVSPDGKFLASCGDDGAIMIWDVETFEHVRTLRRDRPYERLNITGIRGLTEAQKATLQALGAVEG